MGPKYEIFKAAKTRFNLVFWLGDPASKSAEDASHTFDLPIFSNDKQIIPAKLNLWIEVNDDLPENLLNLLHGRESIR